MKNKLRLLLFEDCDRHCKGCCNKDWDLDALSIETKFGGYDEILLTGGEPMLYPLVIAKTVVDIRRAPTIAPIYLYTAKTDNLYHIVMASLILDGITVTLHEQKDVLPFTAYNAFIAEMLGAHGMTRKSFRLNVFKGVEINTDDLIHWKIKTNMEWIKDCPLPKDEVFRRLPKNIRKETI